MPGHNADTIGRTTEEKFLLPSCLSYHQNIQTFPSPINFTLLFSNAIRNIPLFSNAIRYSSFFQCTLLFLLLVITAIVIVLPVVGYYRYSNFAPTDEHSLFFLPKYSHPSSLSTNWHQESV